MSEKKKSDSTNDLIDKMSNEDLFDKMDNAVNIDELMEGITDLNMEQIILGIAIMIILGFLLNILLVGLL